MSKKTRKKILPYALLVEWSEEDQIFIGRCPELFLGGVHGNDRQTVYEKLCQVVDEWDAIFEEDGRPLPPALVGKAFSGKFVLRLSPDLHRLAALRAKRDGESLNSYVVKKLAAMA